jgi:hypothetical protein
LADIVGRRRGPYELGEMPHRNKYRSQLFGETAFGRRN